MRVAAPWLQDPAVKAVFDLLQDAGFKAYAVGGAVRDACLGVPSDDIDLSTDAPPQKVQELAKAASIRAVPTGIDHGTVTLVVAQTGIEVTTFRKDVETDGRRAVIAFTGDIAEDAARRDFTLNALYLQSDGTLVDPLGGYGDLNSRHIRFIGNAETRIREDYLRILRFFRFVAQISPQDAGFDMEALAAIAENLDGLQTLSAERIGAEMRKLLSLKSPARAMGAMDQAGVLARILPGASVDGLFAILAQEDALGVDPTFIRRLVALGGEDVVARWRLSKNEARALDALRDAIGRGDTPQVHGYRLGANLGVDAALLSASLTGMPASESVIEKVQFGASQTFPLRAVDLLDHLQGPEIGKALKSLESAWIESNFTLSKPELLARLQP